MRNYKFKLFPLALCLFAGLVYLYTASPSMLWLDAGDLISASVSFGVSNPPVPLYLLLTHFFSLIPLGTIIFRFQIFSALLASISLYLLYRIIFNIVEHVDNEKKTIQFNESNRIVAGIFGLLTLAFSYEFWAQSQNTERFVFTCFIELIVLYLIIFVAKKKFFPTFLLVAFLLGLSTGIDPVVISFFPSVLLILLINKHQLGTRKLFLLSIVGLAGVVSIYSYLPLASLRNPFFNYQKPTTIKKVWDVATGQGLNVNSPNSIHVNGFTGSLNIFITSSWHSISMVWLDFTPFILLFIVIGGWYLWRLNKEAFWVLSLVIVTNFILSGIYLSGNQDSWYLLPDISLAVFAGFGYLWIITKLLPKISNRFNRKYYSWLSILLLLASLVPLITWWAPLDRHNWNITNDYIHNLYTPLNEPAILFGGSDLFVDTSYFVHDATNYKHNVVPVIDTEFYLIKPYRENLLTTTHLKIPDDSNMTFDNKAEYSRFVNDFFAMNLPQYKVYVTYSALFNNFIITQNDTPSFSIDTNRFKLIPAGLAEEVVLKNTNNIPDLQSYSYQFSSGFPRKQPVMLENSYNQQLKGMLTEYASSYLTIGDYFSQKGNSSQALSFFQKSYDIDPGNANILSKLGYFYAQQKQYTKSFTYFSKAHNLTPQNPSIIYNMAIVQLKLGKKDEAKILLRQVLNLAKSNAQITRDASNALTLLGDTTLGADNWKVFSDSKLHLTFSYPPGYEIHNMAPDLIGVFAAGKNNISPMAQFYSKKVIDNIDLSTFARTFPYAIPGQLSVSKPVNVDGFHAAITNLYTSGKNSNTELLLLKQGDQVIAIIVPLGTDTVSTSFASMITRMLQSVQTLQ